ncbi:MAG: hypothetical protein IT253_06080 [Chitinophagaceae bacterium]|nr:hypothetical protein [Chitinophagaceae bacterium]
MKVNFSFSSTDSIYIAPKDEVFKYTFFDLRTFKYQDYESFTDTATPVSNYRYKPNGLPYIGEHFIKGATQKLNMNAAQMMADTMMNNKLYKRMSFKEVHKDSIGEYFNEEIYYFLCGGLTGAYHLIQPELEKLFPGCSNVRTDIYFTGPGSKITIISESFIARKLNKEEDQIFSKWKQNAIETKLPLLTQDEILKMKPFIPIKYKNHPLFNEMSN